MLVNSQLCPIADPDNIILSLPEYYEDLIYDITTLGSMGAMMNAKSNKNYNIMNLLREHGLNPFLSDEYGDNLRNRFYTLIRSISISAKVNCDQSVILPEFINYKCFRKFHFSKHYTIYEYEHWIGSFENLCFHHIHKNVELICVVKNITKSKVVLSRILPSLCYTTKNGILIIKSNDVHNLLKYE
jgi:hypothetical protein